MPFASSMHLPLCNCTVLATNLLLQQMHRDALEASLQAFSMKMVENGESTAVYTTKVVIHSALVIDAVVCVVLIFCRLTQNIRAKGFIP